MVGIVLASHGELAAGVRQTSSMVFGDQENVAVVSLEPSMGPDDFRANLEKAVATLEDKEQVLFLVDLWGGTPFNQTTAFAKGHDTWAIVTGLSLPMVIEAFSARFDPSKTAHEIAAHIVGEARKGVRVLPEELEPAPEVKAAPAAKAGAIAPGTVLGDGKIDIAAVRIDTRLLHGQVATAWTKQIAPNRIIVVSDGVAHDELRKTMIEQAAPPGVPANVVPISKMVEVAKDPRFGATKAFLLFETPQDLLKCIEGGVDIKKVNIGSMAHSVGKVVVTNAIAMGEDDVKTLEELKAKGVEFEARKVPSDSSEDIDAMLRKAKAELAEQAK
ncbi:MAG: PTS sugar transporter subunit IIB [Parolsenella sp.]|uniref:PTS sugar transporter subunit IIB n=1 Tax=unclassified Parolsenella TaxID=2623992 RepID=UPI002A754FAB|nr:PTS sugar transporter subunit IIB [Parolsenella sp.]MCI5949119.1 PTS sugar transporter subunit IIB [Coriobacteriaceae bacterium]MDY3291371.1 PTS sugar transporter subunit IIB [Parolsenella sp.]